MYTHIYQNSYIVLIITFILLSVIFYLFELGYNTEILPNGKVVRKFSWKYPLAISLVVWVFWHFYLYPPPDETKPFSPTNNQDYSSSITPPNTIGRTNRLMTQRINMTNWN